MVLKIFQIVGALVVFFHFGFLNSYIETSVLRRLVKVCFEVIFWHSEKRKCFRPTGISFQCKETVFQPFFSVKFLEWSASFSL